MLAAGASKAKSEAIMIQNRTEWSDGRQITAPLVTLG